MPVSKFIPAFTFAEDRLAALKALAPEAFNADGRLDWDALKIALGEVVEDGATESFGLNWPGKRAARRLALTPVHKTLVPVPGEGVDEASTRNIFIEGDNLDALKLLRKAYAGRVKMIYIDPPYNTGNDFIYKDDFRESAEEYQQKTGQRGEEGERLVANPKSSGRFHSNWLNMIYPRLLLARDLLREDGVIFVSIDDNEVHNLRQVMDEVFGPENWIASLVWEKARKNDAKLFSIGHDYALVMAKSRAHLNTMGTFWREEKPGAKEIYEKWKELKLVHGQNSFLAIQSDLRDWYAQLPNSHPSKKLSRYRWVDKYGPWRDDNISWPGGGGPRYAVIHPKTGQPCTVPERGWIFSKPEKMEQMIRLGIIEFREDHTEPPMRKSHIRPPLEEMLNAEELNQLNAAEDGSESDDEAGIATQVMPSVVYKQAQVAVKYVRDLMDGKFFDNPKDHEVLARFVRYVTEADSSDIVLDFFAGSGSFAEAVIVQNAEDGGDRKYIVVQLDEKIDSAKPAYTAGYSTISSLSLQRIRRAIKKLNAEKKEPAKVAKQTMLELDKASGPAEPLDLGFKVFKIEDSQFKRWADYEGEDIPAYQARLDEAADDPLRPGWVAEAVLTEIALQEGFPLDSAIATVPEFKRNVVRRVSHESSQHRLFVCLDERIYADTIANVRLEAQDIFICFDHALGDEAKLRLADACKLKVI